MKLKIKFKKSYLFWAVNLLLVLGAVTCILISGRIRGTLQTMNAAEQFAGKSGEKFAQIACFLPVDDLRKPEDIYSFRQKLESQLTQASMEAPENGSLYVDAYSGTGTLSVSSTHGNAQVKAIGVGGNFFYFHPLKLRSGSYLTENDLMQDRVILDEELAWKLFGGVDLAGMNITIGKNTYYVAGVVSREKDKYSKEAYTDGAGIFMSYSVLEANNTTTGIDCYEIVLPNPISGFGKGLVKDQFSLGKGDLVENSSRYSLSNLLSVIKTFDKRSMRLNSVVYPYWENAIRLTESRLAMLLILTVVLLTAPIICTCIVLIRWLRRSIKQLRTRLRQKIDTSIETRKTNRLQAMAEKRKMNGER